LGHLTSFYKRSLEKKSLQVWILRQNNGTDIFNIMSVQVLVWD